MKFKAPWFEDGNEVDLPDMKVEGTLEVAELTKECVDDFIPFVTAMQEEASMRSRINALAAINEKEITQDNINIAKGVLAAYGILPEDNIDALKEQCNKKIAQLSLDLFDQVKKTARVTVISAPFFQRRSLVEAYYMMKAYYWKKAKDAGKKPTMPFSMDDLKTMISDPELAQFTAYSMSRIKEDAEKKAEPDKEETSDKPEELKKKW